METECDVVIAGAGAAGLSAGLVLARARVKVVVVDDGHPRNAPAAHMHGYLSRDGMAPADLLATGADEVAAYGGELMRGRIADIARRPDGRIDMTLDSGEALRARAVLIATGLSDELPEIPGLRERWGTDVHHCPHCHGYEVRDQAIGVIGGPMRAMSLHQAALLRRYSDRVTLYLNGMRLSDVESERLDAFGVGIVDRHVAGLRVEAGSLTGLELDDGHGVDCEAVFIAPRPLPHDALLRSLGCAVDDTSGWVTVDSVGQTSIPGVWAAGNVVNPRAQVITAAGAGSAAAIAMTSWLLEADLTAAASIRGTDARDRDQPTLGFIP